MGRIIVFLLCGVFSFTQISGQIINTVAGNGMPTYAGDGGPATLASIGYTGEIVHDHFGNYYFIENNNTIRKVDANGIITTVAGNGTIGFSGDGGLATAARLNQPVSLAVDKIGNLFVSDRNNHRIRKINITTNIITTVAGNGISGFSGDGGLATTAQFNYTYGIAIDTVGNLFIADYQNYRIRKVTPTGITSTVVGTGIAGHTGDGGPGTTATIGACKGLYTDINCNLYICDENTVRKLDAITGNITKIAGTGISFSGGDGGSATSAGLNSVMDIAINTLGELYICDMTNNNIRKVDLAGVINTVAGTGIGGFNGDGIPAISAQIWAPRGISIDACDNVYISDNGNSRIRKVTFNPPTTPTITITSVPSVGVGATVTLNATLSGAGSSYTIKWFKNNTLFSTTSTPTTTYVKGAGTDTIKARVIPAVSYCFDSTTSATQIITESSVGVENFLTPIFRLYPNPAQDVVTIVSSGTINTISVFNIWGKTVVFKECTSTQTYIPLGHLPKGVYLVRVNGVYMQRFVKE